MAKAIYNNLNSPINCIDYNQREVLKEKEEIANKDKEIDVLGELNKLTEERLKTAEKVKLYVNEIISAVPEASKGIEESSSSVLNIAREIQDISSASRTLRKNVEEISNYLDNFSDASSHIVNIADQTNLISLNAAIEAARAGEEGKSFSVVAEAIKKLSLESKKVANSTKKEQDSLLKLLDDLLDISDT